ncbi:MAG TPA: hypothetical protein VNO32_55500 [Candidatus Acidoferrum sp.]|nr:hypothetical protein [Candidatus Acidoferrum sp.]
MPAAHCRFEIKPSMRRISVGRSKKMTSKTGENRSAKELCPGTGVASAAGTGTGVLHPAPLVSPEAGGGLQFVGLSTLAMAGFGGAVGF